MTKRETPRLQLLSVEDPAFAPALDVRLAEMRKLLSQMDATSPAVAWRALREAFPEAPLDERVRAMTATRH
jgi:hypothetical protein